MPCLTNSAVVFFLELFVSNIPHLYLTVVHIYETVLGNKAGIGL